MDKMPIEIKVATLKEQIVKMIDMSARDFGIPPFLMVGIISEILNEWRYRENIELNFVYSGVIKDVNETLKQEDKKEDVQD